MRIRRSITLLVFLLTTISWLTTASARSGRQGQIPNNIWGCEVCHTQAGGLNDFGFDSFDYTNGGTVNWGGLSQEDSDRDGYSNGLELADPTGSGGNNGGMITHPGDRGEGLCGNGSMEGEEECEGNDLGGATCASMGLVGGTLTCTSCRFDTSLCDSCGDGVLQGGEECDGADLNGNTCESMGRGTGSLGCNGCSYDYSGCSDNTNPTPLTCGDGIRQDAESCDGSDLGGQTCATLGYTGGILGCEVRCGFDVSGCTGAAPVGTNPGGVQPTSPGSGITYPSPGQQSTSGTPEDDPQKIELSGHACSTAPAKPANAPAWLLLVALVGFARRRR